MFEKRRLPRVAYYGLSVLGSLAALKFTLILESVLDGQHLLFIYLGVVMASSLYGGFGPGALSAFLACLFHDYFVQYPRFSLSVSSRADAWELILFLSVAAIVSWIGSAMRAARNTAEVASKAREDMVAIVSHDLKTPLTSISMHAQLISRTNSGSDIQKHTDQISKAVIRMTNLVNSVLDLEKIKQGFLEVDLKNEDPRVIVDEIIDLMEPLANEKNIRIERSGASNIKPLSCDRQRLLQALSNLISNSLKFTPSGGKINCFVEDSESEVKFIVQDTGSGISKEEAPLVFDRYWQASKTAKKGNGLGLYITKGIIEAHKGHIDVKSEPGQGTQFSFSIPRS